MAVFFTWLFLYLLTGFLLTSAFVFFSKEKLNGSEFITSLCFWPIVGSLAAFFISKELLGKWSEKLATKKEKNK